LSLWKNEWVYPRFEMGREIVAKSFPDPHGVRGECMIFKL